MDRFEYESKFNGLSRIFHPECVKLKKKHFLNIMVATFSNNNLVLFNIVNVDL